jgi:cobalt/nickel transport system permease protein
MFAVHIADGILNPWWLLGGFVLLSLMMALGLWRMQEEEVARTGVLTAVLFVATLIHPLPLPGVRVHMLLNGLAGILLGVRVGAAIPLALLLQALLFSHGGLTTLGVNSVTMGVPALLAGLLFIVARRTIGLKKRWQRLLIGGSLGFLATTGTCVLYYIALRFGAAEDQDLQLLATVAFVFHIPVIILESLLVALIVDFLYQVKPELLGISYHREGGTQNAE